MADDVSLFAQLITMGFPDDISLTASKQCQNINEAIEWMDHHNNRYNNNDSVNSHQNQVKFIAQEAKGTNLYAFHFKISILT